MKNKYVEILNLSRKSNPMSKVALKQFRDLKKFSEDEYHILSLKKIVA